jgi:hypothetical protein
MLFDEENWFSVLGPTPPDQSDCVQFEPLAAASAPESDSSSSAASAISAGTDNSAFRRPRTIDRPFLSIRSGKCRFPLII